MSEFFVHLIAMLAGVLLVSIVDYNAGPNRDDCINGHPIVYDNVVYRCQKSQEN